jgi:hypothetical protein
MRQEAWWRLSGVLILQKVPARLAMHRLHTDRFTAAHSKEVSASGCVLSPEALLGQAVC